MERLKREEATPRQTSSSGGCRINDAANAGLLQTVQSNTLKANIPRAIGIHPTAGLLLRRVRSIIVNPKLVDPATINTYDDLGKPELKGKLCLRKKECLQSITGGNQIVLKGQTGTTTWVNKMVDNVKQPFFSGDVSLIRAVGQGKWCGRRESLLPCTNASWRQWQQ